MKYNYGTINRPIKIKKRVEKSPHIINLTPEALQWEILSKALRKRIGRQNDRRYTYEYFSGGFDSSCCSYVCCHYYAYNNDMERHNIIIRVDGLPPSPNQTTRKHWTYQAKVKKEWGEKVYWLAKAQKPILLKKAHIHYKISVGDNRRHDPDNLAFSVAKIANDALVGVVIEDDSIDNIELSFEFDREKPRGFTIQISERQES